MDLDPFRRFLVSGAQSHGKIINHSAIGQDCGVPRKQSERHFEILIDTLVGHYLHPYSTSIRKRQTRKSKFYFFNNGVLRTLQNLNSFEIENSTFEYGNLFESFLINEFFKLSDALLKRWEFSYFQTSSNNEIELIIEKPRGKPILIKIKSFQKIQKEKLKPFIQLAKKLPHEVAYVLSNDPQALEFDGVRCLYWRDGLSEIFELKIDF